MRIAFISYEFPPDTGKGGIGTYVKQIAGALAGRGCDVHVFAASSYRTSSVQTDGYWVHLVQCTNGEDYRIKVVNSFKSQHDISRFQLMESPEINGNAWEIKKKYPEVPLVVRLHAPDYLVDSLNKKYIPFSAKLRFVLGALRRLKWDAGYWRTYIKENDFDYQFIQSADAITAPSSAMKAWIVKYWQIPQEKIAVIPNIFFPPPALLAIPIVAEPDFKQIIFFGRLNVLKGLVNATKAMKKILREYPDWKFKVIGDDGNGPFAGISMRAWMKKKLDPVISQVEFTDGMSYEAIPGAIEKGEIILLPSLFESFSYTCAEAMAAGKAIAGSNAGGMSDLLQHGESGLLVDPEKAAEIYNAVKKLIDDNDLRYQLSVKARKRILEQCNTTVSVEKFVTHYHMVIDAAN